VVSLSIWLLPEAAQETELLAMVEQAVVLAVIGAPSLGNSLEEVLLQNRH
jgi:hypothetical protein